MIIRIENENGYAADIGERTGLKLLKYPDFGNIKTDIVTERIPGLKGERVMSVDSGAREITLKIETGIPTVDISRVFVEGSKVRLIVDGNRYINGIISGMSLNCPTRGDKYRVMNLIIRCPDPFFRKIGGEVSASFTNNGGGIYETGDYTYTKLVLHNEGDVPCPVNINMSSTAKLINAESGLLTYVNWNNGNPILRGIMFKKGTDNNAEHFITTDISSERFFESWEVLRESEFFLLPPGDMELFAQNVKGSISFEPLFLFADGGDS